MKIKGRAYFEDQDSKAPHVAGFVPFAGDQGLWRHGEHGQSSFCCQLVVVGCHPRQSEIGDLHDRPTGPFVCQTIPRSDVPETKPRVTLERVKWEKEKASHRWMMSRSCKYCMPLAASHNACAFPSSVNLSSSSNLSNDPAEKDASQWGREEEKGKEGWLTIAVFEEQLQLWFPTGCSEAHPLDVDDVLVVQHVHDSSLGQAFLAIFFRAVSRQNLHSHHFFLATRLLRQQSGSPYLTKIALQRNETLSTISTKKTEKRNLPPRVAFPVSRALGRSARTRLGWGSTAGLWSPSSGVVRWRSRTPGDLSTLGTSYPQTCTPTNTNNIYTFTNENEKFIAYLLVFAEFEVDDFA